MNKLANIEALSILNDLSGINALNKMMNEDTINSTNSDITASASLSTFLPAVRGWFEDSFDAPTPPQSLGWPAIQRGDHTLILSPTGSGKTLAAFLWGIDQIVRDLLAGCASKNRTIQPGVRLLYISPLKALNNDIERNLRIPLEGISQKARELGAFLPDIRVAVRSGDTRQRERQSMVKNPPHILITTPESFYLMLTSPRARDMFRSVRTVIVDEIHTLAGNKRGVHLSLSLERLDALADLPVQRLGLSATIQPLEETARFLGGASWIGEGEKRALKPRQVTIINAAYQKSLDLKVVSVVDDYSNLPGGSIWPSIIPEVLELIHSHKTTLVFANNRRLAERTADRLNEQIAAEQDGRATGLIEDGVVKGIGILAVGTGTHTNPIRVHHGSVAREARLEVEHLLKTGQLPALVGTSSLELGIDIGTVDLIVQLQSPKSVAQGLQRIGRSGHLVGQTSKGRLFPTFREDVIESAAIAGGMLRGLVEPTMTPQQPLDVLAQQIVAMVSVADWDVQELFDLVRCAYAYHDLTWRVFQVTLEMLAGRYPSQAYKELRARLSWDRVNQKLAALPGSRLLALTNGGTIPDTGSFSAYLSDGKTKLGELDEEFVYETRVGDTLMLGSQVWRVIEMTDDRVMVTPAPGSVPRMPFWKGEYPWRPYELGVRVGAFRRLVAEKLMNLKEKFGVETYQQVLLERESPDVQQVIGWLCEGYALDTRSSWHTLDYIARQLDITHAVSSDRTIILEFFTDPLGDARLVVHSPFGGRVNGPWGLALTGALRRELGVDVEVETNDNGILLRLLDTDADFPLETITQLTAVEARDIILRELPDSAVFGSRFRQNAARALLLPGIGRGKRTPYWLQRLRARDLLQVVRHFDDFPIVVETYRDCLQDVMDVPHLEVVLEAIAQGTIEVVPVESFTPSPVAQSLLWDFINIRMYEDDAPRAEQQLQRLAVNPDLLQDILKDVDLATLLRPEAIQDVHGQLQHTLPTSLVRTREELAVLLQQMGDLSPSEVAQRAVIDPSSWIGTLSGEMRLVGLSLPAGERTEFRWVAAEYETEYKTAFQLEAATDEEIDASRRAVLHRYLNNTGPITFSQIYQRYAFPKDWLRDVLDHMVEARVLVHGRFTPAEGQAGSPPDHGSEVRPAGYEDEYVVRSTLEHMHRRTMTILRREVKPVPFSTYADFLVHWQHLTPSEKLEGDNALTLVLQQLRAYPVLGRIWERDVLPLRVCHYDAAELEALCDQGELVWVGSGVTDPRYARIRFLFRGEGNSFLSPLPESLEMFSTTAQDVFEFLRSEGAVFFTDISEALELTEKDTEDSLIELVMAGVVTNDQIDAMRRLVTQSGQPPSSGPMESSFARSLAQRRSELGLSLRPSIHRPGRAQYRSAKQRVRHRLAQQEKSITSTPWAGRWTPVHRFGVMGKKRAIAEATEWQARQLLQRYGIVTYTSLADEEGAWDWQLISRFMQRMEMRGEVRRGYFVNGLPGMQFALPDVVEQLRLLRDLQEEGEMVVVNAADPAMVYGLQRDDLPMMGDGQPLTFARVATTYLVQSRGVPIVLATNTANALITLQGADTVLIQKALAALFNHLSSYQRRLKIETFNGEPVLESPAVPVLEAAGCYRAYPGMEWVGG